MGLEGLGEEGDTQAFAAGDLAQRMEDVGTLDQNAAILNLFINNASLLIGAPEPISQARTTEPVSSVVFNSNFTRERYGRAAVQDPITLDVDKLSLLTDDNMAPVGKTKSICGALEFGSAVNALNVGAPSDFAGLGKPSDINDFSNRPESMYVNAGEIPGGARDAVMAAFRGDAESEFINALVSQVGGDTTAFTTFSGIVSDQPLMQSIATDDAAIGMLSAHPNSATPMAQSQTAMSQIAASQTAMQKVTASQTALEAVAVSQPAMQEVAASQTAMQEVAPSQAMMTEVAASQTAMQEVAASQTAMTEIDQVDFAVRAIMCGTTTLDPTNFADADAISQDAEAMQEIAGDGTTMATLAASQTALQEVADSQTARNAIASSGTAVSAIEAASSSGFNSVPGPNNAPIYIAELSGGGGGGGYGGYDSGGRGEDTTFNNAVAEGGGRGEFDEGGQAPSGSGFAGSPDVVLESITGGGGRGGFDRSAQEGGDGGFVKALIFNPSQQSLSLTIGDGGDEATSDPDGSGSAGDGADGSATIFTPNAF